MITEINHKHAESIKKIYEALHNISLENSKWYRFIYIFVKCRLQICLFLIADEKIFNHYFEVRMQADIFVPYMTQSEFRIKIVNAITYNELLTMYNNDLRTKIQSVDATLLQ